MHFRSSHSVTLQNHCKEQEVSKMKRNLTMSLSEMEELGRAFGKGGMRGR